MKEDGYSNSGSQKAEVAGGWESTAAGSREGSDGCEAAGSRRSLQSAPLSSQLAFSVHRLVSWSFSLVGCSAVSNGGDSRSSGSTVSDRSADRLSLPLLTPLSSFFPALSHTHSLTLTPTLPPCCSHHPYGVQATFAADRHRNSPPCFCSLPIVALSVHHRSHDPVSVH